MASVSRSVLGPVTGFDLPKCMRSVAKAKTTVIRSSVASNSMYAKEMERVAAKETLLLAIQDAGGLQFSASSGTRVDVNEKVLALERLNPTARPTTSPLLEGLWQFQWAGAGTPATQAAKLLLNIMPSALVSMDGFSILVMDGTAKATFSIKLFGTVETSFVLTTKLTAEGPSKFKEEYVEGLITTPSMGETTLPSQLKGLYDQLVAAMENLPDSIKDSVATGLKFPINGAYQRFLLISYIDEEILIARDASGVADVLLKSEPKNQYVSEQSEYQS